MYRVGVDVGGTNIAIGIVDETYKIVDKTGVKTSEASSPEEMIKAIATTVTELIARNGLNESEIESIGVGVPGTAELDTGKIMYANNLGFEDVPFLPELQKALGKELGSVTCFDNDANAAAIGEYITGGYDAKNFVMVTLGTGIGGGIIIDGKVVRGINYAAAEIGHMTINVEGVDCNCGRRGCFENYASATALINQAKEAMQVDDMDGEKFFGLVRKKNETALKVLDQFTTYLSEGLIDIINILQPEVLVLSGGITRAADFFIEQVRDKVSKGVYSRTSKKNTFITVARGIADAGDVGIVGAALISKG
ncbi:glucokinase [Butyrivibrio hungatei DSM 14810]|uniref:Glucokinase n=1 Tax=Butyrivibrio hungatei DSM 14810 TaxID=1121132 RepID=A0A1M7T4A2_9FIRM|nr:ROK family protein [Butyrivibrio hungatei]SHN65549.1 glucokinase [Butyrivibrio hungatei DSM 14810]